MMATVRVDLEEHLASAAAADMAGIERIARTHGKQPPVGPVRKIQRITGIYLFSFNYFRVVLPVFQLSLFLQH